MEKIQVYDDSGKRQYLRPLPKGDCRQPPHDSLFTDQISCTANTAAPIVFPEPFTADVDAKKGVWHIIVILSAKLSDTPNLQGVLLTLRVKKGANVAIGHVPNVFQGELFTMSVHQLWEFATGDAVEVEIIANTTVELLDVDCRLFCVHVKGECGDNSGGNGNGGGNNGGGGNTGDLPFNTDAIDGIVLKGTTPVETGLVGKIYGTIANTPKWAETFIIEMGDHLGLFQMSDVNGIKRYKLDLREPE